MNDASVTYDPDTGRYRAEYAPDDPESVPNAVVFALAAIRDADPVDLPPLGDVVDTDALGAVFRPSAGSDRTVTVTFEYADHLVTVHNTGTITLEAVETGQRDR